ncbi:MAG: hypothetical protein FWG74_02985 [Planctomycetes bacterium]|nr:hypothetical protein [Planctomycetota bacterium]
MFTPLKSGVALAILLIFGFSAIAFSLDAAISGEAITLSADPPMIDFGKVHNGQNTPFSVKIKNESDKNFEAIRGHSRGLDAHKTQ